MRPLHYLTDDARPMLFIRQRGHRAIVRRVPAESLNEDDVRDQVRRLATDFPPGQFEVDVSQVSFARDAIRA